MIETTTDAGIRQGTTLVSDDRRATDERESFVLRLGGRWTRWSTASANRSIFAAAGLVGMLTFVVKLLAMAKDLILAYRFGTNDQLDAFLAAFALPALAVTVFAESLNAAYLATYVRVRERQGEEAATRLLETCASLAVGLLLVLAGILALARPFLMPIISGGFAPAKAALASRLYLLLLPTLVLSGLITLWTATLNASHRFLWGALAPAAVPLTVCVVAVMMGAALDAYALTFSTTAGYAMHCVILGMAIRRRGIAILPRLREISPAVREVGQQYLPVIGGALLLSSSTLVDRAMASWLTPGSISILNYGSKLVFLVTNIGTVALGTALLPHFARMVAHDDWVAVRHTVRTYIGIICLVTIPLAGLLIVFSRPIVALIYQHGAFTASDTTIVARVQSMYLIQLPFYALGILFVRLISSMRRNRILLWGSLMGVTMNTVLNIVLMRWMGIAGIALSTSIVYVATCTYLGISLLRALRDAEGAVETGA